MWTRDEYAMVHSNDESVPDTRTAVVKLADEVNISKLAFISASDAFLKVSQGKLDLSTAAVVFAYAKATIDYVLELYRDRDDVKHTLGEVSYTKYVLDVTQIVYMDVKSPPPATIVKTAVYLCDLCTSIIAWLTGDEPLIFLAASKANETDIIKELVDIVAAEEAERAASASRDAAERAAMRASDEAGIAAENALRVIDEWVNSHGKPADTFPGLGE